VCLVELKDEREAGDRHAGLVGGADRDPAHPAVSDLVADLEAEGVPVEGKEASGPSCGRKVAWMAVFMTVTIAAARCRRFLIGLVSCFATHGGIPAVVRAAWRR